MRRAPIVARREPLDSERTEASTGKFPERGAPRRTETTDDDIEA
jgi:hypothetical protein